MNKRQRTPDSDDVWVYDGTKESTRASNGALVSEKVHCSRCGKSVSSPVPKDTVVSAFVECPECGAKQPEVPLNQRLFDLVRYKRMELHEDNLISDEEYYELAKEHPAVARLEDYDRLRQREEALRDILNRLVKHDAACRPHGSSEPLSCPCCDSREDATGKIQHYLSCHFEQAIAILREGGILKS